jgi:hypothetical protein
MTPVERAAAVYESEACARSFREDLEAHLLGGFVFSRPDFFIMGRPVVKAAPVELIVDPWHRFHSSECDCWHVFLFSGNMVRAWAIMPWELPWFSWERKNELRFIPVAAIRRLSGA